MRYIEQGKERRGGGRDEGKESWGNSGQGIWWTAAAIEGERGRQGWQQQQQPENEKRRDGGRDEGGAGGRRSQSQAHCRINGRPASSDLINLAPPMAYFIIRNYSIMARKRVARD